MGDELRPANGLIEVEQLIVDDIIDGLAVGVAIDVGCAPVVTPDISPTAVTA
jgi:hypothetical protein